MSQKHDSYIKDTFDFVNKLRQVSIPPDGKLFTIDIESLYTNIQTQSGLGAVKEIFRKYPDDAVLRTLELGLTRNDFEFNNGYYLQIHGTAMGKKFAHAYAIFIWWSGRELSSLNVKKIPILYVRFLDDIFGIWSHSESDFFEVY